MNILSIETLTALLTLSAMEIVLGIDNIIFISIVVSKAPKQRQEMIRNLGIALALLMRIALLLSITWMLSLSAPLITLFAKSFSGRDLILLTGGLFLLAKSTLEIHHKLESSSLQTPTNIKTQSVTSLLIQIILLDIVFSLDSVITAIGMVQQIWIMLTAMIVAMVVMLASAKSISNFVNKHPTVKLLALSFLILIGVMLVMEGMGQHIEKGYIYFAMAFSLAVEALNIQYRKNALI